jgi:hypothetical protein
VDFLPVDLRAAVFLAVDFLPVDFFAADFLPVDFLEEDFLAADFLPVDFLEEDFLAADFLLAFRAGTLAPDSLASLSAIATACLRLVTLSPELDLSFPCLCSFITLWILSSAFLEYLAMIRFYLVIKYRRTTRL